MKDFNNNFFYYQKHAQMCIFRTIIVALRIDWHDKDGVIVILKSIKIVY